MNTPPSARPPRSAMLIFVVLLVSAAGAGVALDRVYLARSGQLGLPGANAAAPLARPSEEQLTEIFDALRRELSLRDDQVPAVRRIMAQQIADLEELRRSLRPELDSIFEITRDSLDTVLDASQRARRDALLAKMAPLTDSAGLRRR
ncbi:MAG: hypothetical protein HEQ38_07565 [Gemmatimonas sp.]|nr:hypothetical protein [Gemmatimonas sp.]